MSRWILLALALLALLALPASARAQEPDEDASDTPAEEVDEAEAASSDADDADDAEAPATDPLGARLEEMVQSYYAAIGSSASASELQQGIQSVQLMLLDGVSIARIDAAIAAAIDLHTPGRRIPFQVAVPLRVRPADEAPAPAPEPVATPETRSDPPPAAEPAPDPADRSVVEKRWVERQEQLRKRRNRLRLHLQWKDRTRDKRILLAVGAPLFLGGWAGTFGVAGAAMSFGEVLPSTGWTAAIPVAGPVVFGVLSDGAYPAVFAFAAFQGIGLALTIAGLAKKVDWPYDRDPTALHLGRDRKSGKPVLTIHPGPMGVVGRF